MALPATIDPEILQQHLYSCIAPIIKHLFLSPSWKWAWEKGLGRDIKCSVL